MAIETKTTDELANEVLLKLRKIRPGGSTPAKDGAKVLATYQLKFLELEDEGLVYWELDEAIPALIFLALVKIVAAEMATDYGYAANDPDVLTWGGEGMDRLRKIQARKSSEEPVEIESF